MKVFILFIIFFSYINVSAQQQHFNSAIENFMNDSCIKNAPVSIYASNTHTGETLVDINGQLCITPASVIKLVTTATALEVFGSDYKFSTTLWHTGTISGDTLYGDIIVTGGGDPTLGSQYFNNKQQNFLDTWATAIKEAGILHVLGNIVADPFIYSDQDVPQSWVWEDLGNYYGAAAQGINLYDNTFRIFFKTSPFDGGDTEVIRTEPTIPGLETENFVTASTDMRDRAFVFGSPFESRRIIRGTLPRGRSSFSIRASIPDPAFLLSYELMKNLLNKSITIDGSFLKQKVSHEPDPDQILYVNQSPELKEIIKQINYESINLFAEQQCKHLGLVLKNNGSTKSGTESITEYWEAKGIESGNIFLADGSGLSRYNAINSETLTKILVYMQNQSEHAGYFIESIPLTGINGTQQYYFQSSELKGKARAKTGSMTRVRSLAGYIETQRGTSLAFTIISNNFNCGSFVMAAKMEKILEAMYLDF
jgi:D-alanyl-D-alanine carboxypeptidase/D-alanyl-D-alanine-endopeptidase (penicillin-binding protein 4)